MSRTHILSKEQLRGLINERGMKTEADIMSLMKDMFADTLQEMLEAELDTTLGYKKGERQPEPDENRRNGHSKKKVSSEFGETEIEVPRDRTGEHEPIIVKKHQKNLSGLEEQIIAMYSKGMTTRDIQDHLDQMYGVDVSPALISNVTAKLMPLIKEWQNRPLESIYTVVFLDAIHYKVRQEGTVVNKAAYMVIGIDIDGKKDVLGIWIGEHESSKFWLTVLNELRNRGVQDILICCVDNLKGFSEAITACFPEAEIQKCIVHQIRNTIRYVSSKDVRKLLADLKAVYTASSEAAGLQALEEFEKIWGVKYPLAVNSWRQNWPELSTFFKYPPEIRKIIYTTNIIESYHRQLRKVTKGKSIFPNDESLQKMLYLATMDVTRRWTSRVKNWGQILVQFNVFFPDKVLPVLN